MEKEFMQALEEEIDKIVEKHKMQLAYDLNQFVIVVMRQYRKAMDATNKSYTPEEITHG